MKWIGNAAMALGALCLATSAQALETHWSGASGLLPDAVDPRWTLVDEGGGSPSFAGGCSPSPPRQQLQRPPVLHHAQRGRHHRSRLLRPGPLLAGGRDAFRLWQPDLRLVARPWPHEFPLRQRQPRGAGDSQRPHLCAQWRQQPRAQVVVDTDDAFHTYRLEALGRGHAQHRQCVLRRQSGDVR